MAPEACRIKTNRNATSIVNHTTKVYAKTEIISAMYTDVRQARTKARPTEEAILSVTCNQSSRLQASRPSCTQTGMFDPQACQVTFQQEKTVK